MFAMVYEGPGQRKWQTVPDPAIRHAGDDLHILKGETHRFAMDEFDTAYQVFEDAAHSGALKVLLTATA